MNLLVDTKLILDYTTEQVSLATAKAYMKVAFADDDTIITSLIKNARIWLENYTGKSFGTRKVKLTLEMDVNEWYELPGPVQTVDLVEFTEYGDDVEYTLVGSQIKVHHPGLIDISITYGYTTIPEDMKNDILSITAYTYQNRGIDLSNENANLVDFPMLASQYYRRIPI